MLPSAHSLPKLRPKESNTWTESEVARTSGKTSGKYRICFSVTDENDSDRDDSLDFANYVEDWRAMEGGLSEVDDPGEGG